MHKVGLVFQGGGARGVYHLGALKSVEEFSRSSNSDEKLNIEAVAGTSIGALVASLVAVGYTSRHMVKANGYVVGIGSGGRIPKHFLGCWGWWKIWIAREYIRSRLDPKRSKFNYYAFNAVVIATIILIYFTIYIGLYYLLDMHLKPSRMDAHFIGLGALLLFCLVAYSAAELCPSGLVGLDDLGDRLNRILARKIAPLGAERERMLREGVTFRDIWNARCPVRDLRIVATDVSAGTVKVFSMADTADVRVSDAVMASMCLPFLFKPTEINNNLYYDGSIMSNRPAWVFDFDRIVDPDLYTLIFNIETPSDTPSLVLGKGVRWLLLAVYKAVYAGLLGEKALEVKPSTRNIVMELAQENIGLLDIDMTQETIHKCIKDGYDYSNILLRERFLHTPEMLRVASRDIEQALFLFRRARNKRARSAGRIRIYFSTPREKGTILRSFYCNEDGSTADRLFLPLDDTIAGQAFATRKIECVSGLIQGKRSLTKSSNRYRRALKAADGWRAWSVHIPVELQDSGLEGNLWRVVTIEGEKPLEEYGLPKDKDDPIWDVVRSVCASGLRKALPKFPGGA